MVKLAYILIDLVLFALTKQGDSACRFLPRTGQFNGCQIPVRGVTIVIPINSSIQILQPTCEKCNCHNDGVSCCSLFTTPTDFPNDCKLIYDGCKPFVVKKNDETVECPVTGGVG